MAWREFVSTKVPGHECAPGVSRRCVPSSRMRAGNSCLPMVLVGVCGTLAAIGAFIICNALFDLAEGKPVPLARMLAFGAGFIGAGVLPTLVVLFCEIVSRRRNRQRWREQMKDRLP